MPSTRRPGVDSALPKSSLPVASSNTAMSVKVPPISAASLMLDKIRQPSRRPQPCALAWIARAVNSGGETVDLHEILRRERQASGRDIGRDLLRPRRAGDDA